MGSFFFNKLHFSCPVFVWGGGGEGGGGRE